MSNAFIPCFSLFYFTFVDRTRFFSFLLQKKLFHKQLIFRTPHWKITPEKSFDIFCILFDISFLIEKNVECLYTQFFFVLLHLWTSPIFHKISQISATIYWRGLDNNEINLKIRKKSRGTFSGFWKFSAIVVIYFSKITLLQNMSVFFLSRIFAKCGSIFKNSNIAKIWAMYFAKIPNICKILYFRKFQTFAKYGRFIFVKIPKL